MRPILFLLCFSAVQACVSTPASEKLSDLIKPEQQQKLLDADVILLGEQHDNPHHHAIQKQVIDLLGEQSLLGSVVFEQVNWDQQSLVANLNNRNLGTLAKDLAWDKSGWPSYAYYEPLFTAAVRYRASVIAGNVAPANTKAVYKEGYNAIFQANEQQSLGLKDDLAPAAKADLEKEIFDGHCQMIPKDHVQSMIPVQRTRDAAMAWAWFKEHKKGKAVFIVGSGHARKDYGIPLYINKLKPGTKVYSLAMNETGAETNAAVYDQVITTAPAEREDPCAGLKEKFSKPKS